MPLDNIDIYLLNAIYEKDTNSKDIIWKDIGFESTNHAAFHLLRLENNGLISMSKDALSKGGQTDPKYGLNIALILYNEIHIEEKGIDLLRSKNIIV